MSRYDQMVLDSFYPNDPEMIAYLEHMGFNTFKKIQVLSDEIGVKGKVNADCIGITFEDEKRKLRIHKKMLRERGIKYGKRPKQ